MACTLILSLGLQGPLPIAGDSLVRGRPLLKIQVSGASEMVQGVKTLVTKPDLLSSIHRTCMMEARDQSLKVVL